jgi:hypothetical protein
MSDQTSPSSGEPPVLDSCGCCGSEPPPPTVYNRPGLPALAYRVATQPTALRRMLGALPRQPIPPDDPNGKRPLRRLTARTTDDPAVALLDAWATVSDVVTFYQERIANEGYLRTATERRSVLELARAIGYELNPGVAASTFLAFTVEDAPGAPGRSTVPAGTKVQSVPAQGQLPQTFETSATIDARAEWNALPVRQREPQVLSIGAQQLYLRGVNSGLQPGDAILPVGDERLADVGSERWDFRVVRSVTPVPPRVPARDGDGYTLVTWDEGLGHTAPTVAPTSRPRVWAFRQRASLFGHNAPEWRSMASKIQRAYDEHYDVQADKPSIDEWPDFVIRRVADRVIDLDALYPKILAGSWIALERPGYIELYGVRTASPASRTDFTLTARTTRLALDTSEHLSWFGLRDTIVHAQSEELHVAEQPLADSTVQGDTLELDRLAPGLQRGQPLIVSGRRARARAEREVTLEASDGSGRIARLLAGATAIVLAPPAPSGGEAQLWRLLDAEGFDGQAAFSVGDLTLLPADADDPLAAEVAFVDGGADALVSDGQRTTIRLRDPLAGVYDRSTVSVNANVTAATHGETVPDQASSLDGRGRGEVLGGGDGAQANQQFALRRRPLTYVSAPTPSGAQSTLELRVNGVLWQEASSLYGLGPRDERYTIRIDDDGLARLIFGDGQMGARLPTGSENITASYRFGEGRSGMVASEQLTLLQVRPLGVRGVTNPLPATGGADPEVLADARANAPLTVLTLGRIVSLRDFEDFARSFAGVGKAQAVAIWIGEARLVHVTVAGMAGAPVPVDSALYVNLVRAIDAQRDPVHTVQVASYAARRFGLDASVLVDRRLIVDDVLADVAAAIELAFSFDQRAFGQPVTAAEVVEVMQGVAGVVAVDLDRLVPDAPPLPPESEQPVPLLPARPAQRLADGTIVPAELLVVNRNAIRLKEMSP